MFTEQNTQGKCALGSKLKNKGLFHLLRQTQCKGVREYLSTHITMGRRSVGKEHLPSVIDRYRQAVYGSTLGFVALCVQGFEVKQR